MRSRVTGFSISEFPAVSLLGSGHSWQASFITALRHSPARIRVTLTSPMTCDLNFFNLRACALSHKKTSLSSEFSHRDP